MKVVATFVLPTFVMTLLAVLPWLDRGGDGTLASRKIVVGIGSVCLALFVGLTAFGVANSFEEQGESDVMAVVEGYDPLVAGEALFREQGCVECHFTDGTTVGKGPNLGFVGVKLQPDYLRRFLNNPSRYYPETVMPTPQVNDDQLDLLVGYLRSLEGGENNLN